MQQVLQATVGYQQAAYEILRFTQLNLHRERQMNCWHQFQFDTEHK